MSHRSSHQIIDGRFCLPVFSLFLSFFFSIFAVWKQIFVGGKMVLLHIGHAAAHKSQRQRECLEMNVPFAACKMGFQMLKAHLRSEVQALLCLERRKHPFTKMAFYHLCFASDFHKDHSCAQISNMLLCLQFLLRLLLLLFPAQLAMATSLSSNLFASSLLDWGSDSIPPDPMCCPLLFLSLKKD